MKHRRKYFLILLLIILALFLGYKFLNYKESDFNKKFKEDTTPVPITDWISYVSDYGFSFMHPIDTKVEIKKDFIKVANLILKIEKLNCENGIPTKNITDDFRFYGFKAEINENKKSAYICNNTKTACLDIFKEKEKAKITEGFFHSFISSLNINNKFDEISCIK